MFFCSLNEENKFQRRYFRFSGGFSSIKITTNDLNGCVEMKLNMYITT